jgi:hypothetical protein
MHLVSAPFFMEKYPDPQVLEAVEDVNEAIIEEREGIHYINRIALDAGSGAVPHLNRDFKDLVDSVIGSDPKP